MSIVRRFLKMNTFHRREERKVEEKGVEADVQCLRVGVAHIKIRFSFLLKNQESDPPQAPGVAWTVA